MKQASKRRNEQNEQIEIQLDIVINSMDALCEWSDKPEKEPEWKDLMKQRNYLQKRLK